MCYSDKLCKFALFLFNVLGNNSSVLFSFTLISRSNSGTEFCIFHFIFIELFHYSLNMLRSNVILSTTIVNEKCNKPIIPPIYY